MIFADNPPSPEHGRTNAHSLTACTRCCHTGQRWLPGYELISKLHVAVDVARQRGAPGIDFAVDDVACMADHERPRTFAYRADGKSCCLFGDVDRGADIDAPGAFAVPYAASDDGWTKSTERPKHLACKPPGCIPCALAIERQADNASC
ncbi:MAG: DUF1636 family protein [Pseudomonadota bacterium]